MVDNPQAGDSADPNDLNLLREYEKLVLEYEALDEEIDGLLALHHGGTENMSVDDYERYRQLAHQRDDMYHRMKALENQLFVDDVNRNIDNNGEDDDSRR